MSQLPDEGKAVVVPADTDPETVRTLEEFTRFMGVPVIVSEYAPAGTLFVIDMDVLHGRPSTAERAMSLFERMKSLVDSAEYRRRFGVIKGVD